MAVGNLLKILIPIDSILDAPAVVRDCFGRKGQLDRRFRLCGVASKVMLLWVIPWMTLKTSVVVVKTKSPRQKIFSFMVVHQDSVGQTWQFEDIPNSAVLKRLCKLN